MVAAKMMEERKFVKLPTKYIVTCELELQCPHCCDVLGRYDQLGYDVYDVIKEHVTDCYLAQKKKKEQKAILKVEQKVLVKILTACSLSNEYNYANHLFEIEPAPNHKDNPDSEAYKVEKEINEYKHVTLSNKLVAAWQTLKELVDSSDVAKKSFIETWNQQVSTYTNSDGLSDVSNEILSSHINRK